MAGCSKLATRTNRVALQWNGHKLIEHFVTQSCVALLFKKYELHAAVEGADGGIFCRTMLIFHGGRQHCTPFVSDSSAAVYRKMVEMCSIQVFVLATDVRVKAHSQLSILMAKEASGTWTPNIWMAFVCEHRLIDAVPLLKTLVTNRWAHCFHVQGEHETPKQSLMLLTLLLGPCNNVNRSQTRHVRIHTKGEIKFCAWFGQSQCTAKR